MQTDDILLCFEHTNDANIRVSKTYFYEKIKYFSCKYSKNEQIMNSEINSMLRLPKKTICELYANSIQPNPRLIEKQYIIFIDKEGFINFENGNARITEDNIYFMKLNWRNKEPINIIDMLRYPTKDDFIISNTMLIFILLAVAVIISMNY
jgi:hypothetical protein